MNKILREEMEYLITCDDKAITKINEEIPNDTDIAFTINKKEDDCNDND